MDLVTVDITPAPPTQTVSTSQARSLRDGSVVRIENKAAASGTADLAGRLYIEELDRSAGIAVEPVVMTNREVGGAAFGAYTPGVVGSVGLNNIGLLVTACGRVVYRGSDFFVIDDGGRMASCGKCPASGIAVSTTGLSGGGTIPMPPDQSYVIVTGISSCFTDSATNQVYPLLRPRNSQDVRVVSP